MSNFTNDHQSPRQTVGAVLGSAALIVAVVIVGLAFIDTSGGLPFSLPRSWYTNRALWYLLALACFGASWFLLKRGSAEVEPAANREAGQGARFDRAVLYTREGCHLCDEMRLLLERYARYFPVIEERDIDADAELKAKFTECVPVLEIDGKVRFRGRINETLLQRLIDATPPR